MIRLLISNALQQNRTNKACLRLAIVPLALLAAASFFSPSLTAATAVRPVLGKTITSSAGMVNGPTSFSVPYIYNVPASSTSKVTDAFIGIGNTVYQCVPLGTFVAQNDAFCFITSNASTGSPGDNRMTISAWFSLSGGSYWLQIATNDTVPVLSSPATIQVPAGASGTTPVQPTGFSNQFTQPPTISSITYTPNPIKAGQSFKMTIEGSWLFPFTYFFFIGPNCDSVTLPCSVQPSTDVNGHTVLQYTLPAAGSYKLLISNSTNFNLNAPTMLQEGPFVAQ